MDFDCLDIETTLGFEWDDGNVHKNQLKWSIIEEIFFNDPLLIVEDFKHSEKECRCVALGINNGGELITIIFTVRVERIRVISARMMSKKERLIYEYA